MEQEVENIRTYLKEVIDPELGINIVDLGLVYDIKFDPEAKRIMINLTLSTTACPLGDVIMEHVNVVLSENYPDYDLHLSLVWEPRWNRSMISADGLAELGW